MNQTPTPGIDLIVLDDHAIVRQGVMMMVQQLDWINTCRGAAEIADALRQLEESPADVAIVDLSLKRESGLEAISALLNRWPLLRIVVLSMHADQIHFQRAMQRGALGFVAKDDATDELAEALVHAAARKRYMSHSMKSLSIGVSSRDETPLGIESVVSNLTQRERQVLGLLGRGCSAAEIAIELGRSIKTIEAHRNNLREKLGLRTNRQLLQFSAKWVQFDRCD